MKNLKNKIKKIIYIVIVFIPLLKCTSKPILDKLKKYRKSEKEQYREHLKKINQVKLEVPNKHKVLIKFTTKSGKILERPMYLECNKPLH
ncbi:MAG: hypothetical protein GY830_01505 [Bacteroidetes bacterium]|nr:hypothetical protein [Bacteroidota bacterium]